jgi:hypothetical protein
MNEDNKKYFILIHPVIPVNFLSLACLKSLKIVIA